MADRRKSNSVTVRQLAMIFVTLATLFCGGMGLIMTGGAVSYNIASYLIKAENQKAEKELLLYRTRIEHLEAQVEQLESTVQKIRALENEDRDFKNIMEIVKGDINDLDKQHDQAELIADKMQGDIEANGETIRRILGEIYDMGREGNVK